MTPAADKMRLIDIAGDSTAPTATTSRPAASATDITQTQEPVSPNQAAVVAEETATATAIATGDEDATVVDDATVGAAPSAPVDGGPESSASLAASPKPTPLATGSSPFTSTAATDHRTDAAARHAPAAAHADDLLARAELQRVTARGSRLDIGISTASLGDVKVEAVDLGDGLQLHLTSDHRGAREHLHQHLDELRADLAGRGIDVGTLDVGDHPRRGHEPTETERVARSMRAAAAPVHTETGPLARPSTHHVDGLDLRL